MMEHITERIELGQYLVVNKKEIKIVLNLREEGYQMVLHMSGRFFCIYRFIGRWDIEEGIRGVKF